MTIDICDHFSSYFSLSIADTPELKKEVYKIRYRVYCEELNYEPKENFPNNMERDVYDSRSIHCLLKHKPSGIYAGCVRIVLADLEQPEALFPMEKVCQHNVDFSQKSRLYYSEVSRLAVISQFRKRKGEQNSAVGLLLPEQELNPAIREKRKFPVIALSLYLACISIGITLDLDYAFMMMEARLSRHMRFFGIPSELVGDFVEYHSRRGPFLLSRTNLFSKMKGESRSLFDYIHSQLKEPTNLHSLYSKYKSQSSTLVN